MPVARAWKAAAALVGTLALLTVLVILRTADVMLLVAALVVAALAGLVLFVGWAVGRRPETRRR